jgi:predicted nucleic acid-binding protein
MTSLQIAVDSSVLVALLNPQDLWRTQATDLQAALLANGVELLYFDCVVTEAISTATRRLHEKRDWTNVDDLLNRLMKQVPLDTITWIFPEVQRMYPTVIDLMRASKGALNFNDALIALACRERNIPAIASFDADFDSIDWLQRLSSPEDLTGNESTH